MYYIIRSQCNGPDEHKKCDTAALKILAPCLPPAEEAVLVKSICLRRVGENDRSAALAGLFMRVARLELLMGNITKAQQTCDSIRHLFSGLPRALFKRLALQLNVLTAECITHNDSCRN